MRTVLKLMVREKAMVTARWPDRILDAHPPGLATDAILNMRLVGCDAIRSEIHGKTEAVLIFEWLDEPRNRSMDRDKFVHWWANESGWDYKVEPSLIRSGSASHLLYAVTYLPSPDVYGRPCVPPVSA